MEQSNKLISGLKRQVALKGTPQEIDLFLEHEGFLQWFFEITETPLRKSQSNLEVGLENRLVLKFVCKTINFTPYRVLEAVAGRYPQLAQAANEAISRNLKCHIGVKIAPGRHSCELYYYPDEHTPIPDQVIATLNQLNIPRHHLGGIGIDTTEELSIYYKAARIPATPITRYLTENAGVTPPVMAHIRIGDDVSQVKIGVDFRPAKPSTLKTVASMAGITHFLYLAPGRTFDVGSYFFDGPSTKHALYFNVI